MPIGLYISTIQIYENDKLIPDNELTISSSSQDPAFSKSKNKDSEGNVTGIIIRCKNLKSRLTKENTESSVMLSYESGLDRYYGLVDLALEHGIFEKVSTKIRLPDGSTAFEKSIVNKPEKYFTEEILSKIDAAAKAEFSYGTAVDSGDLLEEMLNDED